MAFDLEGTLLDAEMFPEIGRLYGKATALDEITDRCMNGKMGFEESLIRRMGIIKGLSIDSIKELRLKLQLHRGAKETIAELKRIGCVPAILTGGFDILVDPIARELGISFVYSNRFVLKRGRIVAVQRPIVTPELKADIFVKLSKGMGFDPAMCVAVGDGANDIKMMEVAGLSIAFNAKNCVKDRANVVVESGDLRDILPRVKRFKERFATIPR